MREIRLEQAFFGMRSGRGHTLLASTLPARSLPPGLIGATDRPSTSFPGAETTPYVFGQPFADWYAIGRTLSDPEADPGRIGSVFTHVFLLSLPTASELVDLASVLEELSRVPYDPPADVEAVAIGVSETVAFEEPNPRQLAAARRIIDAASPVVWMGYSGFEEMVARLWASLWPAARTDLAFSITYDRPKLKPSGPKIVVTPDLRMGRWTSVPVVGPGDSIEIPTPAERYLAASQDTSAHMIGDWLQQNPLHSADVSQLRILEGAIENLRALESLDLRGATRLLRSLEQLGPTAEICVHQKAQAVQRVLELLCEDRIDDLLVPRNLRRERYTDQLHSLITCVQNCTAEAFDGHVKTIATWLQSEVEDDAPPWWINAVSSGIQQAIRRWSIETPRALWTLLEIHPDCKVPDLPVHFDAAMAAACPKKLPVATAMRMQEVGRTLGWHRSTSAALAAAYSAKEATRRLFQNIDSSGLAEAVDELASRIDPGILVNVAQVQDTLEADEHIGMLIARDPSLRRQLNLASIGGLRLWATSIEAGAGPWIGFADVQRTRNLLLDAFLHGKPIPANLLSVLIAEDAPADLYEYPRRTEVWDHIAEPIRSNLLDATTKTYIERFQDDPEIPDPELPLRRRLDRNQGILVIRSGRVTAGVHAAVTALTRFRFSEMDLISWLETNKTALQQLTATDARALGTVIRTNRWRAAARWITRHQSAIRALIPVADEGAGLLSAFERLTWGVFRTMSGARESREDLFWNALHEFACSEYPSGPMHEDLWQRAGGKPSRLMHRNTGEARWRAAINALQSGRTHISVVELINTMKEDFPSSYKLNRLFKYVPRS